MPYLPELALACGVMAVLIPVAGLFAIGSRLRRVLSFASFLSALASLCAVVGELARFARIGDSSGFCDTVDAFLFCCILLSMLVSVLNGVLLAGISIRRR